MQIVNGQPCLHMCTKKWENCALFFYTECAVSSGKVCQNCVLWQKLYGFRYVSKLCCKPHNFLVGLIFVCLKNDFYNNNNNYWTTYRFRD